MKFDGLLPLLYLLDPLPLPKENAALVPFVEKGLCFTITSRRGCKTGMDDAIMIELPSINSQTIRSGTSSAHRLLV